MTAPASAGAALTAVNPTLISAGAALAGTLTGGVTSIGATWLTQWAQLRDRRRELAVTRRERLFAQFIDEASRLYGDALSHEKDDVADLVTLYAMLARIRLVSTSAVVTAAERTLQVIIETYLAPNQSLQEVRVRAADGRLDFLNGFSDAARGELAARGGGRHGPRDD